MMKKLAIAAAMAAISSSAMAAEATINATVDLMEPLQVTGTAAVNFGTVAAPSSGIAIVTVDDFAGGSSSLSGGTDAYHPDDGVPGNFFLEGEDGAVVTITVAHVDAAAPGLTLTGASAAPIVTLNGSGEANVPVGGTLEITNAATAGDDKNVGTITLTANY